MGPLHPADSQSHAGSLGHQFQSSLETPAKLHLHKLSHFFFFPERLFQPAVSTLTIPVLNPLQGRIHLLDNPTRSDLSQAPLHAIVLHQVKSLLQSSIEEPTDTSSPAIDCTPCKTHSKHFLMDHRPRQDRVYPCFAPYSHDVAQSPAFGTIPSLG